MPISTRRLMISLSSSPWATAAEAEAADNAVELVDVEVLAVDWF